MAEALEKSDVALSTLGMHDRYGPFMRAFFARYFDTIRFPARWLEKLRSLSAEATLVYVAPSASLLHFLYLNHLCNQQGLPRAAFANGVNPVLLQPVDELLHRLHHLGRIDLSESDQETLAGDCNRLSRVVQEGQPVLLFLDSPVTVARPGTPEPQRSLLQALIAARLDAFRQADVPLLLDTVKRLVDK